MAPRQAPRQHQFPNPPQDLTEQASSAFLPHDVRSLWDSTGYEESSRAKGSAALQHVGSHLIMHMHLSHLSHWHQCAGPKHGFPHL